MLKFSQRYKLLFKKEHIRSFIFSLLLLAIALVVQYYSHNYLKRSEGNFVNDFFLDNLPVIDLNWIIIEGALGAIFITLCAIFLQPRYIIFSIKAIALFIITRSLFVDMTHLGIYPDQIVPGEGFFDNLYVALNLQGGYFFSGHTGLPFMMALIFWEEHFWRYLFFTMSVVFGIAVLFAHVHYSIDVFASPFIAYGIFKISQHIFVDDFKLTQKITSETNVSGKKITTS